MFEVPKKNLQTQSIAVFFRPLFKEVHLIKIFSTAGY